MGITLIRKKIEHYWGRKTILVITGTRRGILLVVLALT